MEECPRECVTCSACGYEIASAIITKDEKRALTVHKDIKLTVIDKEKNIGSVQCPICGAKTPTNLAFWRRF